MIPKKKANELIDKFRIISYGKYSIPTKNKAKECALIAVDEILNNSVMNYSGSDFSNNEILSDTDYWNEVKKEIELR
jgi:hypothetical protein